MPEASSGAINSEQAGNTGMGERGLKITSFFMSIESHSAQSGRKPWQNCPNFLGCPGRILYLAQSQYSATDYKMVSLSGLLETHTHTWNTFLFLFIRHQIDTDREWILGKNLEERWIPPVELLDSKGFITMTFCFPTKCLWKPSSWPFVSWRSTNRIWCHSEDSRKSAELQIFSANLSDWAEQHMWTCLGRHWRGNVRIL